MPTRAINIEAPSQKKILKEGAVILDVAQWNGGRKINQDE